MRERRDAQMRKEMSQWSKNVRKAMIDKDMTFKQLAEQIGYSITTVSSVINGRYSNASKKSIRCLEQRGGQKELIPHQMNGANV